MNISGELALFQPKQSDESELDVMPTFVLVHHCDSRWNQIIDATYTLYSKLAYLGFYFENGEVKVKDNPEVADNVQAL